MTGKVRPSIVYDKRDERVAQNAKGSHRKRGGDTQAFRTNSVDGAGGESFRRSIRRRRPGDAKMESSEEEAMNVLVGNGPVLRLPELIRNSLENECDQEKRPGNLRKTVTRGGEPRIRLRRESRDLLLKVAVCQGDRDSWDGKKKN